MEGKIGKSKEYFQLMEELYSILLPFAVFDNVVGGVRRRIDVARAVTEDVRGIMAEEARRARLVSSIQKLSTSLKKSDGI